MSNQAQQTSTKYFDLHVSGIGYVNRIREVKPKKGESFWACSVAALRGTSEQPEYTNFDCRINGAEAERLIRRCVGAVDAKKKVLIGFKIGDIYPESFTYQNGEKKGQTGECLKGRLLFVSFIKIDGEEVFKAAKPDTTDATGTTQAKAQPTADVEGVNSEAA
ncbi:MAG: STY4534 family ICE replication protein [Betaproteobacteria bacterium]|nr:STY4534 family ICE replication protein [Betaproteobacteria bacterium]